MDHLHFPNAAGETPARAAREADWPARDRRAQEVPTERSARSFVRQSSLSLLWVAAAGVVLILAENALAWVRPNLWDALACLALAGVVAQVSLDAARGRVRDLARRWRNQVVLLTMVSVSFGIAAAFRAQRADPVETLCVMSFLLFAVSAPATDFAYSRGAIALWIVPLLLSPCFALVERGTVFHRLVALVLLSGGLFSIWRGRAAHAALVRTMRYQIENEGLVAQLREHMARAVRANEEKTRFIATAAHDLRQPLHALGLFAASAEQRLRHSSEYPLIKNMMRAMAALEQSFTAILDISRLDAGSVKVDIQAFPVRDLFRRLYIRFAGDAENRGLSLRFCAAGKFVRSDPQLLERIVANLLQNALRYTQSGGVIVVARRAGDHLLRIEVRDSGIGIPREQLKLIFEEFYQVNNAQRDRTMGLGMGLAIVRRICALLDHPLDVKSQIGRGSVFSVTVPYEAGGLPLELELGGETLPPREVRQLTLLVIDDDQEILNAMSDFLALQQFRVLLASGIEEAVKVARESETPVDVIFSDLRLGGSQNGIQAIRAVRQEVGVGTPAVIMTGDLAPERLREAHEGGLLVLAKPVSHRQILKLIDRLPI